MSKNGAPITIEGSLVEGSAEADANGKSGMVTVDLIREGFGNRRDQHFYTAEVLREAAPSFIGAQMYANHLSPELQEKLKGLPRNIQDLMGRIRETEVVTDGEGRAVIRGIASISQKWLWDMVEHDPDLLGVSINARGRSIEGQKDGRTAKIVEAISTVGSVDWVSKAGAGGKVFALMEAQAEEEAGTEIDTAESPTEESAEEAAAEAATQTHHHHHHHASMGVGRHVHSHHHDHPDAVAGETNTHSELTEAAVSESDATLEEAAVVQHHHDHVHKGSLGKGSHLHIHHHHHTLVAGESHTHESNTSGATSTTESEAQVPGEEETPPQSIDNSSSASGAPEAATSDAPEETSGEEETTEAAGDAVHHHYHNHDSMGRGHHRHHHHHKAVDGETHDHVTSGSVSSSSRYNEPSSMGEHNHHHHHASMGAGHHIHHHTHNLVPGEAHTHSVEPMLEAEDAATEGAEEMLDEAYWIAGAIKHKGALHRDLGVPEDEKIPVEKIRKAAKRKDKIGQRARLALTLMKMHHGKKHAHATEAGIEDFGWESPDSETTEAEVDRRATELAQEKLKEGVKSAVEITREEFDKKLKEALAENDWKWERKVGQLEQRQLAAALIEKATFESATERALKGEFYDAYFEDKRDDSGAVLKSGEEICREAVKARIKDKREELREFTSARISEAGETTESQRPGGQRHSLPSGEELPKRAPLDAQIDEALAIPAGSDNR